MGEQGVYVELDPHEFFYAAEIGVARRIKAMRMRINGRHGADNAAALAWAYDIDGACAEYALAKHLNMFWSGSVGQLRTADVGCYQVSSTRRLDGSLIVTDDNQDEDIYVLATGADGKFWLRGWMRAGDAKRQDWLRRREGGCGYFVPQAKLEPMITLPRQQQGGTCQ